MKVTRALLVGLYRDGDFCLTGNGLLYIFNLYGSDFLTLAIATLTSGRQRAHKEDRL